MSRATDRRAEAARAREITEELVQQRNGWTLRVYKADRRCKTGERKMGVYHYYDWTQAQMAAEVKDLRSALYPAADGWRLEFEASWVEVRNMMSGKTTWIRAEDQGGVCDPSQERFWSM